MTLYDNPAAARRGTTHVDVSVDDYSPSELLRLSRLARELRLTDQILSEDLDTVTILDNGPAPAWTSLDGDHVSFAMSQMPRPESRVDVAVWLGTNAHELGHVLFSPRRHSPLMARVIEGETVFMRGLADIHNIVEDQRQERLLLGRFAPWRSYLTAALGHHLVADNGSAWLLMAGRTWLPAEVRDQARAVFVAARGASLADEVAHLVGEYQRLVDPGDTEADEAWEILTTLHNLFELDMPKLKVKCVVVSAGEPDTSEPGVGIPVAADEADEGDEDDEPTEEGAGERWADDDDDVVVVVKEGEPKGAKDGAGKDGQGDGQADSQPGAGAGTEPGPFDQRKARRQLQAAADEQIEGDEEAQSDLDSVLDALAWGRAGDEATGDSALGAFEDASDHARHLHHEVGDALLDLKDQTEPGWTKRVDSGRLKVSRLLDPSVEADELFDRYEPGQLDASELELVLLLDVSGSMSSQMVALGEATWAIRQSVDDLEGTATVLTFESGPYRVLATPGERPDSRMLVPHAYGGTNPEGALREAFRILADSQARNRLMVVMTDGSWANEAKCEALIGAMRAEGVTTVLGFLANQSYPLTMDAHGCEVAETLGKPEGLALLFRKVAAAKIAAWR